MELAETIHFFSEDVDFSLPDQQIIRTWINGIITAEKHNLTEINFIFCSDPYLLNVNKTFLEHDYYTDIITFDNNETEANIESDIFISIDRVKENAQELRVDFMAELHRVMIHGVLHLLGWNDKTPEEQKMMREKEETSLSFLKV